MRTVFVIAAAMAVAGCAQPGDRLEQCARATALEAEAIERLGRSKGYFSEEPINVPLAEANMRATNAAVQWRKAACPSE